MLSPAVFADDYVKREFSELNAVLTCASAIFQIPDCKFHSDIEVFRGRDWVRSFFPYQDDVTSVSQRQKELSKARLPRRPPVRLSDRQDETLAIL